MLWLIKGLGPGGAERLLQSTARVGDHARFDYEVAYVLPHKATFVPDLEASGVPVHCLGRPGRDLRWPWRLREHLRHRPYDIIHLHSPLVAGVARLVIRTLPRAQRPTVVSTEHNVWDSYSLPTRLLNASLHTTDARRWAVSPRVKASVWPRSRRDVEVLTHGIVMSDAIDVAADRLRLRSELGVGSNEVVAITVANFRPEKAYPDLLQAARAAFDAAPELRILIVGQGPEAELIERIHGEFGLGDRCRVLGYRADVLSLLSVCDFFVLASQFEGFPIALMEAMASGLPVVATRVGGVPDAVSDGVEGLLVDPGDPDALARAMVRMTQENTTRASMAERARASGEQFDIRKAVAVLEQAYAELAGGPRG